MLLSTPIVLLDEPTKGIDGESETQLLKLLSKAIKGRITIAMYSNVDVLLRLGAQTVYQLSKGKLAEMKDNAPSLKHSKSEQTILEIEND